MHNDSAEELIAWLVEQEAPDGIATPVPGEITTQNSGGVGVEDDGTDLGDMTTLDFGSLLNAVDNGDGSATVTGTDTDTRTDISDSAGVVVSDTEDITVTASGAASVSVADDADGTATVTVSATDTDTNTQNDLKDQISHSVPITSLADTDYVDVPLRIPTGKTAKVWMWGARTDGQTTPTGLTVGLYDHSAAAYVTSQNTAHATGSPITSLSGAVDAALRLENTSGGSLNAGAVFGVTIE